jgi:peptide-methionine (S)-S-oxide reductase
MNANHREFKHPLRLRLKELKASCPWCLCVQFRCSYAALGLLAGILAGTAPAKEVSVKTEKATFAAGCFWGVEAAFRTVDGVLDAQVGYTGGKTEHPTYQEVCTGRTGHAEAIEISFDPEKISYETLVGLFFRLHDPTQVNRQGPDIGTQYRSAVFFHSPQQQAVAERVKSALNAGGNYKKPIATQIVPAAPFHRAEEYHQRYFEKNGGPACHIFQGRGAATKD